MVKFFAYKSGRITQMAAKQAEIYKHSDTNTD